MNHNLNSNKLLRLQTHIIRDQGISLYVPDPEYIRSNYLTLQQFDSHVPFPYWAQVWPAAIAMASFIVEHPSYVADKKVLELAGGLGLPSLVAAQYAERVCCSDYSEEAIEAVEQSIQHHHLQNMYTRLIDWYHIPEDTDAEVILLSDINYEPDSFEQLYKVITGFIEKGATILLSTPQRLMAKPFIERISSICQYQEEVEVLHQGKAVVCSLFVLARNR